MTATFHLTDGTTINNITLYSEVHTQSVIDREGRGPIYTVFTSANADRSDARHLFVPVADVARIEKTPVARPMSWFDLPMAAGMWAADGADLGV